MEFAIAWLIFPIVLGLLSWGCGLLVERLAGRAVPRGLVPGVGLALICVAGAFTTLTDATAELTAPLVVGLAVAGALLAARRRRPAVDPWALGAGVLVFAFFAAPVAVTGESTVAGYIRLDDTASWLAMIDRAMHAGATASGLAPSTYEATLDFYMSSSYPLGGLVPLGVGGVVLGEDPVWLWQPYLSFLAGMLATTLYVLARTAIPSRPVRAACAVVAAQAALVVGFALWGGFKEVGAAWLVALLAALAPAVVSERLTGRRLLPVAVVSAAMLAVLSSGGGIWLLPLLGLLAIAAVRRARDVVTARQAGWLAAAVAVLAAPALAGVSFLSAPAASTITDRDRLANLIAPLSELQAFGIWPAGDFRLRPDASVLTHVLIAVAAAAGVYGVSRLARRRDWPLLLHVAAVVAGGLVVLAIGSPWVQAKALAIASPALVLVALVGGLAFAAERSRVAGGLIVAAVAGGVLWSNALAYDTVNLAPHDRFSELRTIGERFGGQGPTLMTEYEPHAARYLLRDMDPEGASELRRRPVELRDGTRVPKGWFADIDAFTSESLAVYRSLVLRRSPTGSRPPSTFELAWRGRHYEVWQQPEGAAPPIARLPLGGGDQPAAPLACDALGRLSGSASPADRLAVVLRDPVLVADLAEARRPAGWEADRSRSGAVRPHGDGSAETVLAVRSPGAYEVWVGGAVRGELRVEVGGWRLGAVEHHLNNFGQHVHLGTVTLPAGAATVRVAHTSDVLRPGDGGEPEPLGPVVLRRAGEAEEPRFVTFRRARRLCGRSADWVEVVRPGAAGGAGAR